MTDAGAAAVAPLSGSEQGAAANHERDLIVQRKAELQAAQKTRENRLQYDEIARKIVVYPSRDVMESNLQQLQERAAALQQENEAYAKVSDDTRQGLESIVDQLRTLSQAIEASVGSQAPAAPAAPATAAEASDKASPLNPQVPEFTPQSQAGGEPSVPHKRSHPIDSDTNQSSGHDQHDSKRPRSKGGNQGP
ncbi:hypothetical protein CBS14141_003604 [Malassezia furfur]|nr:hypothetical protein CBS14141_003604 [Malassezia furfur]